MKPLPRITVITPTYNQGGFVERTIQSVLSQGYPNLEYLVMDGGSTDDTLTILKRYEHRLVWSSELDRGQSHAINKGLARATGDVVAFLNSDDLYEPGALWWVGAFFADHSQASWLTGRCRVIDEQDREIRRSVTMYKNLWLRLNSRRALLVLDYVSQPATFWRRRVIEQIGEFDESLHLTMDYDYSLRVAKRFKLWVSNEYLAQFRVHSASKSRSLTKAQFDSELEIAKQHTSSPILRGLHALHNALIVTTYRLMLVRGR